MSASTTLLSASLSSSCEGWLYMISRSNAVIDLRLLNHCRRSRVSALVASLLSSARSEEHTSELQSIMRISYAVFCLTKKQCYKEARSHISYPATYSPIPTD